MKFCVLILSLMMISKDLRAVSDTLPLTLESGSPLIEQEKIEGVPWPKVTAYALLDSDPELSMAIFAAYDHQKNYIPDLKVATPETQPSPTEVHVRYEIKMPWPLENVRYLHGHQLSYQADKSTYRLDWWMIESTSTEHVEGFVEFLPYPKDPSKTLMRYSNLITPKSALAGLLRGFMLRDVKKTVEAIITEIDRHEQDKQGEETQYYLSILQDSLKDKKRWVPDS